MHKPRNAVFTGRSTARLLTLLPTGELLNDRAKAKVRQQERGHEAIERRLVALGASVPRAGQHPAEWLSRALEEIGAGIVRHDGNYRYAWAIGDRAQRRRTTMAMAPRHYPKHRDA